MVPRPIGFRKVPIPGNPRTIVDDGDTPANHAVEKRGLTHVGSAHDGDDRNPLGFCGPTHRAHRLLRHSVIS